MAADSKKPFGVKMPSIDNYFTTEEERQDKDAVKSVLIPLNELHPFKNHPFEVRDDAEMDKLMESFRTGKQQVAIVVRPRQQGGYEIISGHRRFRAAQRLHMDTLRAEIQPMDDDAAVIAMIDCNIQRETILPMERARALEMKVAALSRQGKRNDLTCDQVGHKLNGPKTVELVADEANESKTQVQRFIRLNKLIPELQTMVDEQKLKLSPADPITSLSPEQQQDVFEYLDSQSCTPSVSQAQKLKAASQNGTWSLDKLEEIMTSQPPSVAPREMQLNLSMERLSGYFPQGCTKAQMEHQIMKILESYFRQLQHNRDQSIER